jgi:predicted nucleic acid-binding protein
MNQINQINNTNQINQIDQPQTFSLTAFSLNAWVALCSVANRRKVYYLWRPFLRDPKDDMVLELAVSAGCEIIVTYNKDDFEGVGQFGVRVMTAQEFLQKIGELP